MTISTDYKTAVKQLEQYAAELDAKDTEPTADELGKLKSMTQAVRAAKNPSTDFYSQLGEGGQAAANYGTPGSPTNVLGDGWNLDAPTTKAAWGDEVARRLTKTIGDFGVKAVTTGGIDIPQAVSPVVTKPVEPVRVLDLFARQALQGNEFEYLRQTVRTNNAAVVADNATKPTSVYTFEDEFDRARVFAHLSEAIPLRYLADHDEIRNVLTSQMAEDLYLAIEEEALTGDGTGEHFTGIANVTGVQAQAYTTSVLMTLRKARTKLTTAGESPNAWVLNHADLEAIDMQLDGNDNFMEGIDEKVFGNLPKIGSSIVPAGTAYLGDWNQARLYVREGGRLDADMSGELFDKNQVKLRYEGRFGFAVLRPNAFVEIDLTA